MVQRDRVGEIPRLWFGAQGQIFKTVHYNEPSKFEKLQNVANKNCFYQDKTNDSAIKKNKIMPFAAT